MSTYGLNLEILNSTEESSKRGKTNNSGYKREGEKNCQKLQAGGMKRQLSLTSLMPTLFSPKLQMETGAQCMYQAQDLALQPGLLCLVGFNLSLLQIASLPAAFPTGQGRGAAPAAARAEQGFHLHSFPLPKTSHLLTHEHPKIPACHCKTAGYVNNSSWISSISNSNSKTFS